METQATVELDEVYAVEQVEEPQPEPKWEAPETKMECWDAPRWEDTEVELPQRTADVRPGHLWSNEQGEQVSAALRGSSSQSREQSEELRALLDLQHREVMHRLDRQEEMLRQLVPWRPFAWRPAKDEQVATKADSFAWDEASKETRNFRTFEEMDKRLQEGAATVDAQEAAKKKRRAQSQHSLPSEASCLQRIVNHPWFDIFFAVVVVTNSVFVGVEVSSSVAGEEPLAIQVFQYAYTVIFTVELALRILANGRRFILSEEWMWNWMDIFIVLTSLWELAVELATTDETSGSSIQFTGLKALRLVRITRIVKVARLARVLRFVMALRTLISSIIYTLKSLIWAMVLLGLIVYVFAVLFTQAVGDALLFGEQLPLEQRQASERYFGTLEETMLSLFMCIAGGVSWEEVVRPLKAISTAWVFVFLFYIAFTYFAVLNVVTGVFCQSAIDSAQNDQAMVLQSIQANKQAHIEKIRNLFQAIDTEETGVITYKLLEESITSPVVQTFFEAVGLDVWDAWSFFKLLDLDAGGAVEIEEFLMGCLRLKGQAKSMDVVKVMHDQAWLISQQSRFWVYVESELQALKAQMGEAA